MLPTVIFVVPPVVCCIRVQTYSLTVIDKPTSLQPINVQFRNDKIVYRRYAGLFFCVCVDSNDNELAYLEAIHLFVEVLGKPRPSS